MAKKIFIVILNIFLVCLILIAFLVAYTLLPIKNNFKLLSVMSGSMRPTLDVGELVVVKPVANYKVGDIITFKDPSVVSDKKAVITHRIHEIIQSSDSISYKTKGDANNAPDADLIKKDDVIGKFIFGIRYVGYLIVYVKTLPGLIIIIVIPATIIIYEEVKKIKKEAGEIRKRRKQKKDKLKSEVKIAEKAVSKHKVSKKNISRYKIKQEIIKRGRRGND